MKLLAFNIFGAILFLLTAIPLWAEPEVADIPGAGAGSPFVWVLMALPIVLVALAVNVVFLIRIGLAATRGRPTLFVTWHLAIPVIWTVVLYIDFGRHWIV